jgi:UDP-N-acetylmuramoylalanine--D-glutamate ligase
VNYQGKQILVLGAGVTGLAAAHALRTRGANIAFADDQLTAVEDFPIAKPETYNVQEWDFILVSPGWKQSHPVIQSALEAKIPLINEIDLAYGFKSPEQKWIALTGTNGKTTTVEMAAAMLRESGINAVACGNVGQTVIECVDSDEKYSTLVLELSSFQIHWLREAKFDAVAILNIADDHVDWHNTFDEYARVKCSLLERSDVAILNAQDNEVFNRTKNWSGRKIYYSLDTPAPGELGVVEELIIDRAFVSNPQEASMIAEVIDVTPTVPHNVSNALAASALALCSGATHGAIRTALQKFTLGRHRIETVHVGDGITWIDDSKATNPHAAAASIMSALSVIWIAGGLAKGAKMNELVERAKSRLKAAILIGQDRDLIKSELIKQAPQVEIIEIDAPKGFSKTSQSNEFMESVVRAALERAVSGDTVLLAPACASMDQFNSYADRGERFASAVRSVVAHG